MLYKNCFIDLERIQIIYINSNGKNYFRFKTNHFLISLEWIMFDNLGLTVFGFQNLWLLLCITDYMLRSLMFVVWSALFVMFSYVNYV